MQIKHSNDKAFTIPDRTGQYELYFNCMSGDADHYSKKSTFFQNEKDLKETIFILASVFTLTEGELYNEDLVYRTVESAGKAINYEYASDLYSDLAGSDIRRSNGDRAKPQVLRVWFWTSPTTKVPVEFELGGNFYEGLYRTPAAMLPRYFDNSVDIDA